MLMVALLSGCAGTEPASRGASLEPTVQAVLPGVAADAHFATAEALAREWDPEARSWAVVTFEFGEGFPADARENPLLAAYNVSDPVVGDGLARVWTYSFRASPDGLPLLPREHPAFVVNMADDGRVLSAYETDRDDEGALGQAPLGSWAVGSAEAARAAAAEDTDYALAVGTDGPRGAAMLLQGGRDGDHGGPVWDLVLSEDGEEIHVAIDARTGRPPR